MKRNFLKIFIKLFYAMITALFGKKSRNWIFCFLFGIWKSQPWHKRPKKSWPKSALS